MQLTLTSDQQLMRESIRDFVQTEILPHRMDWDETQHFPRDLFGKMGELGLLGMLVPEHYGGAGLTYYEYKMAIEEIAKVCGSIGCRWPPTTFARGTSSNLATRSRSKNGCPSWHLGNGLEPGG